VQRRLVCFVLRSRENVGGTIEMAGYWVGAKSRMNWGGRTHKINSRKKVGPMGVITKRMGGE